METNSEILADLQAVLLFKIEAHGKLIDLLNTSSKIEIGIIGKDRFGYILNELNTNIETMKSNILLQLEQEVKIMKQKLKQLTNG